MTDAPNPEAVSKLEEFVSKLPKASAPRRLLLSVSSGDKFKELVTAYITGRLEKGIPSLFSDIKSLYTDPEKRKMVEDIADTLREKCAPETPLSSENEEDPSTHIWTLYFLSQHYSYLGQHTKALTTLDLALEHTPTLPELLLFKGRVMKRLGDFYGAAKCVNDSRLLDGQDRFLNTKCGKYLLRAGMIEEANGIFGLFTKVRLSLCKLFAMHQYGKFRRKTQCLLVKIYKICSLFYSYLKKQTHTEGLENSIWQ